MQCKGTTRTVAYLNFALLTIIWVNLGLFLHVCSTEEILGEIRGAQLTILQQKMVLSRKVALFFNQLVDYMCW